MKQSLVMPPLSVLYGAIVRARLAAYARGLLSSSRLDAPVISVGNLTVGGTGKTPLVERICRLLADEGRKVCVLTRGYKRKNPNMRVLVSDGNAIHASVQDAGDEPFLLATNLLGRAAVISDANRVEAGRWAQKELGTNAFVLDDGFQHLQIERDLNVLVVDATDPWGGEQLLPVGRLREPLSGVKRANCIVITRTDEISNAETLHARLQTLGKNQPILFSRMEASTVRSLHKTSDDFDPKLHKVSAFCGVGNPSSFFNLLRRNGYALANTRVFPDHHAYTEKDVELIIREARDKGATALITTAKDGVKLKDLQFEVPCFVQEIELAIDEDDRFIKLLRQAIADD